MQELAKLFPCINSKFYESEKISDTEVRFKRKRTGEVNTAEKKSDGKWYWKGGGKELNCNKGKISDPVIRDLVERFPCGSPKRYNIEKISDTEIKFTNPKSKISDTAIKKDDGEWYWKSDNSKLTCDVNENKMRNLKNLIREKLTTKYVDKANKVIKITENYQKVHKHLIEENYDKYFSKMFKLAESYKNSKKILTESDEELFSKGISLLGGQEEKIKEELLNYLERDLGLTSSMKDFVKNEFESIGKEQIGDLFLKPQILTDILVNAVIESTKSNTSEPNDIMSALETVTVSYFDTPDFRYKLGKIIKQMIGNKMEDRKGKIVQMVRDIISKAQDEKKD
jgi:hypothetical protein